MTNLNASILRNFTFWENKTLQFRGEMLNAPKFGWFGGV